MNEKIQNIKDWTLSFCGFVIFIGLFIFPIYDMIVERHWILLTIFSIGGLLFVVFLFMLPFMLGAGFRNKFPMDYLFQLGLEIKYFEEKGFSDKEYTNPGTDNPGVILERDGKLIEINLLAPLMAHKLTTTISSPNEKTLSLEYDTSLDQSEKISKLAFFYQELDKIANNSPTNLNT